MKRSSLLYFALVAVALSSCTDKAWHMEVKNNMDEARADEVQVIARAEVEHLLGSPSDEKKCPVVKLLGEYVPSQIDDIDLDGEWDELAFLVNIGAGESLRYELEYLSQEAYPSFSKRTNVRLGIHQEDGSYLEVDTYDAIPQTQPFQVIAQGESVNWENDKMGFRNYFDCRNVKDLFGKRTGELVLDKIHTPEMGDYHQLADWGMDVLHCGNSVGSGGLALFENDSLYRLGSTDTYTYQKISEGPVRSIFELQYTGWHVGEQTLTAVERISIYPGKYWFQSDVTLSGFEGEKQLATGIVTTKLLQSTPQKFDLSGTYQAIATLDAQSLNNDELGMAVVLKQAEVTHVGEANKEDYFQKGEMYQTVPEKQFSQVISDTYFVAQKIMNDKPARHYFAAVWGLENEKWKEMANFKTYLEGEAKKWENPLEITLKP
ncbi:MAG: DUF4861 domain-containing protein [Mangrovibacterium sp.]